MKHFVDLITPLKDGDPSPALSHIPDQASMPETLKDNKGTGAPKIRSGLLTDENGIIRSLPCPANFDETEARNYGGVWVCDLAEYASELIRIRIEKGVAAFHRGLAKFTVWEQNALHIYTRVKHALKRLADPMTVEIQTQSTLEAFCVGQSKGRPWDVSPAKTYRWAEFKHQYGFDVRGTSLVWIERQVDAARSRTRRKAIKAFRAQNEPVVRSISRPLSTHKRPETSENTNTKARIFKPIEATFGQIWPPVNLPAEANAEVSIEYVLEPEPTEPQPDDGVIGYGLEITPNTRAQVRDDRIWWALTDQWGLTSDGIVYCENPLKKPP